MVRRLREGRFEYDRNVTKIGAQGRDALRPFLTEGWQATSQDADAASDDGSGEEAGGE